VGNNLAIAQMLLILVTLVRRYDFAPVDEAPVPIQPMMLLRPGGGMPMRFTRTAAGV
jgi:cytochrome P450